MKCMTIFVAALKNRNGQQMVEHLLLDPRVNPAAMSRDAFHLAVVSAKIGPILSLIRDGRDLTNGISADTDSLKSR